MKTLIPSRKLASVSSVVGLAVAASFGMLSPIPANAQVKAALVRSVDEPARVPYAYSQAPTCPFLNQCVVTFPVVPAGKRLRLTSFQIVMRSTNASGFVMLRDAANNSLVALPTVPFNGAYNGNLHSVNQPVDLIFEAGAAPVIEMGVPAGAGGITVDGANRFGVTGYLVDVTP